MFGISVHIATAGCGDNRDKPRFVEQGASTIWGHITKTNTRLVILRFSQRRSLEHGPTSLPGEQTSVNRFLMGPRLFLDMVSFLRGSSWNSNLCHNMDAK